MRFKLIIHVTRYEHGFSYCLLNSTVSVGSRILHLGIPFPCFLTFYVIPKSKIFSKFFNILVRIRVGRSQLGSRDRDTHSPRAQYNIALAFPIPPPSDLLSMVYVTILVHTRSLSLTSTRGGDSNLKVGVPI